MPTVSPGASATAGASPSSWPATAGTSRMTSRMRMRINLALFAAGLATFALLFSTQALLPDLAAGLGVPADQASWTVSATTIGLAAAVLPVSTLSERFGRRQTMTASLAVAVALAVAIPFAPSLPWLVALRAAQGAALAGVPASAVAYLSEELPPRATVGAVGLFIAGNSVGGMTGRVMTGWVAEAFGWRAALGAVAALAVAAAVIFRALLPQACNFCPAPLRPRLVLRTVQDHLSRPLLLRLYAIGMLLMAAFSAVYTVVGFRLTAAPFHLSAGLAGSVFVIYLVGTGSSAATGPVLDRLGRRGALYLASGTVAAGLLLSLAGSLLPLLAGLVLITGGFFLGHAVASGSVSRSVTHGRAQASALYQVAYYLGASAGGTIGAVLFHAAGWPALVAFALAALLLTTLITLYATRLAVRERRVLATAA